MSNRILTNWLDTYIDYTEQSESPDSYHMWSGISAIASCLRRQVWINMGYFHVYPNLYIVLVGPPGCRKNSAINIMMNLISDIPDVFFSADSITREALIQSLQLAQRDIDMGKKELYRHSSLTIVSKELSVFIGNSNNELLSLLTDLYDPHDRWEYRTKNKGIDTIYGVWLNMLAGTTPAWLVGSVPINAIGGGFTSRIIFVVEDHPRKRTAIPKISERELKLKKQLSSDLEQIAQLRGEFTLTPEAIEYFTLWYNNLPHDDLSIDLRFQGYYERKHIHLLKVAMIVSASYTNNLIITDEHIRTAQFLLDTLETKMVEAFGSAGRSDLANDIDDILKLIQRGGGNGIGRETLTRKVWRDITRDNFDKAISSLLDMGYIKKEIRESGKIIYFYVGEKNE